MDTSYKSQLYYDVIIRTERYRGWYTVFVGMGRMEFGRAENSWTLKFNHGLSDNWMEECWDDFLEYANSNTIED